MKIWGLVLFGFYVSLGVAFAQDKKEFTLADHGRRQLDRMLAGIPEMAKHPKTGALLPRQNKFFTKVEELFAGKESGVPIFWKKKGYYTFRFRDYRLPHSKHRAEIITYPEDDSKLFGAFNPHRLATGFDELWAQTVLSFYKVARWKNLNDLKVEGSLKQIDKDQFVKQTTQNEFIAIKRGKIFFEETWNPWAKSQGIETDLKYWAPLDGLSFEEFFTKIGKEEVSKDLYWGDYLELEFNNLAYWDMGTMKEIMKASSGSITAGGPYESYINNFYIPKPVSEVLRSEMAGITFWVRQAEILKMIDRALESELQPKPKSQKGGPKKQ